MVTPIRRNPANGDQASLFCRAAAIRMTTRHYEQPLTDERLFAWHASLFPSGRSGMTKIRAGAWRDDSTGPMEVVSSPVGKDRVHYQAPPAKRLAREMPTLIRSRKLVWAISGSSPYTRSMTVTVVLRARLQTWFSRAQKTVRNASTACRRRSGRSATPITTSWRKPRRDR